MTMIYDPKRLNAPNLEHDATSELVAQLLDDGKRLIKSEVDIARARLKTEADKAQSAIKLAGLGLGLALVAALVAAYTAVAALATLVGPVWAGVIVTAALGLVAVVLVAVAKAKFKRLSPERAVAPFKEDGRWISETWRDLRAKRRELALR